MISMILLTSRLKSLSGRPRCCRSPVSTFIVSVAPPDGVNERTLPSLR